MPRRACAYAQSRLGLCFWCAHRTEAEKGTEHNLDMLFRTKM